MTNPRLTMSCWGDLLTTRNEDVFPIKNGHIPASYVSLPEGTIMGWSWWSSKQKLGCGRLELHMVAPGSYGAKAGPKQSSNEKNPKV